MDYEKAYKEALAKAKNCLKDGTITNTAIDYISTIFPELKESEDERIRKALITFFQRFPYDSIEQAGTNAKGAIAWLEKQGTSINIDSILEKIGVKPAYLDGNAWCVLHGDNIQNGICGFGYTKEEALIEFLKNLLEKQGEQKPIMNVPSREVILSIWDLGNEWKELTSGDISTEYGTQLDYIQKHWHESEYYLRAKQDEKKVTTIDFNAKDWYVSKVDGKIHNINISSEKQGEKKPINPNAIKDLERAILAAHPTFKQKPTWSGEDERMVEEILDAIEAAEYEMALNMSDVRQWLKNLKQRLS